MADARTARRLVSVTVVVLSGLLASVATATFSSGAYSHANNGSGGNDPTCNTQAIDPISIVFYGNGAQSFPTRTELQRVMGWVPSTGTDQAASSSGFCTPMEYATASAECGTCNRTHIRLNQTHEKDAQGHYETVGTPHYDRSTPACNGHHRVPLNGYTDARADILNGMINAGHHFSRYENWGNTEYLQQCDGSYVNSDGYVGWVEEL